MAPSFEPPSTAYLHFCTPSLVGPASGDVGEFVPLPPNMWAPLEAAVFLIFQTVLSSGMIKTLDSPSIFLKTGLP